MNRSLMLGALVATALLAAAGTSDAGVNVNIGINLAAPPQLVAVQDTPVAYAPALPANYFFYAGQYYVFANSAWYAAPTYNGPWAVVAPVYVPRPLLTVPIRYYPVPPRAWSHWRRDAAPRWQGTWGREWHEHHGDGRVAQHGPGGHGRDHDRNDRDGRHDRDDRRDHR